ncbi:MAG: hypothetical protein AB7F22_24710 [Reyranella sp.]|uniref:hypothetical protein n=1 Tax=Reyranella sp. TaxID=1929291 RepID=UPI003D146849
MRSLTCLLMFLLGALALATASAVAQSVASIAVAAESDLIAVFSEHVEHRLLRVRFDRSAGTVAVTPFGPPGIETFGAGPDGAFVVHAVDLPDDFDNPAPHVALLDASGQPTGKPVASPLGKIPGLVVSPTGDRVAASGEHGWIGLFAVDRTGPTIRLAARATFGVSVNRPFFHAFRPDGGLVTITDDWVMVLRTPDGAIQQVHDLKTVNRTLAPIDMDGLFRLRWSPRGDRFTVNWGAGPMFTRIFDATGHRLLPTGSTAPELRATEVTFIDSGDAAILSGMTAPVVVHLTGTCLASKPFGDPEINVARFVAMAGGRRIMTLDGDRVGLWSDDGGQLIALTGVENYSLETREAARFALKADGRTAGRLTDLPCPAGDSIVVVDEQSAAWVVQSANGSIRHVALPAWPCTVVAVARDGFAIGPGDGTIVRLSRDGLLQGEPIKASEFGGVGLITVEDDGRSLVVVEGDELSARHLDWNGRVLAAPYRARDIKGAFFDNGKAMLILSGDELGLREPAAPFGIKSFEPPR